MGRKRGCESRIQKKKPFVPDKQEVGVGIGVCTAVVVVVAVAVVVVSGFVEENNVVPDFVDTVVGIVVVATVDVVVVVVVTQEDKTNKSN